MLWTCCFSPGLFLYTLVRSSFGQAPSCEDNCLEEPALWWGLGNAAVLQVENSHPWLPAKSCAPEVSGQAVKCSLLRQFAHRAQGWSGLPWKIVSISEIQAIIKMKLKGHGKKMCEKKLEPEKEEADNNGSVWVSVLQVHGLWVTELQDNSNITLHDFK